MLVKLLKWQSVLLIIILSSVACSKDSDEEYSGGGTTASSAKFLVSSTIPEDHATGVSLFTSVVIGFNNDLNSSSVSGNNFSLSSNGIAVPAKLSNSKNVVVLLPSSSLSNATLYSASVSSTVQDISGNSLDQDSSWKFTTVSASSDNSSGETGPGGDTTADTTQPSVVSISPSENASSITVDSAITVVFSESISSASLSSSTFKLMDNSSNSISGSYSLNGSTVTFTPTDNLTHFRDYSVSLTTGIKDSAGNALSSAKSWSFSTLSNVVVISADSFGMVLLSGGQFEMGADNESQSDGTGNSRELPVHTVTLTGPFYVSDHEVTAAEYKACVDAGSCSYTGSTTNSKRTYDVSGEENFPINYVSWNDAANYTSWLTSNRSGTYRLCTEAEWEYAARAGSTTKWSCGNDNDSCLINYAWYDSNSRTGPKAVKTKLANSWGLYDFHGNIWELTSDYYGGSYYSEISGGATNPSGPATGGSRSTRGGGYSSETTSLRSSNRYYKGQTSQSSTLGFRVCATP